MTEGFIQLPGDGSGKKLHTWTLPNGEHVEGVVLVDGGGDQAFSPESPKHSTPSATNLAAGASVDLDGDAIVSLTRGRLEMVTVGSSIPAKWEIYAVEAGTPTLLATIYTTDTDLSRDWRPPHRNYAGAVGGATSRFRVTATNLDTRDAADVHASIYWDEAS